MRFEVLGARPARGVAWNRLLVVIGVPLVAAWAWTLALTGAAPALPPDHELGAVAAPLPTFRARPAQVVQSLPRADRALGGTDRGAAGSCALVDPPKTTFASCDRPCGWFGCSFRLGEARFPDASNPRDIEIVSATVRRRIDEVAGCYEERSCEMPVVEGVVFVDLDVAPNGAVASARLVESDVPVPDLRTARCIAGTLRVWGFPPLTGPDHITARYSFVLSPRE